MMATLEKIDILSDWLAQRWEEEGYDEMLDFGLTFVKYCESIIVLLEPADGPSEYFGRYYVTEKKTSNKSYSLVGEIERFFIYRLNRDDKPGAKVTNDGMAAYDVLCNLTYLPRVL